MANNNTHIYTDIVKFDEQADGSLLVHGVATDATLDSDQQICDPAWLDRAMPDWFKYGNIREQHANIAAGVATEYERTADGVHNIVAHIVDENSVKKVRAGVLKGFSIGIKSPRVIKDAHARGGRIVDGQIVEVSIVDRPANPSCVLTVAKSVNGEVVQVEELAADNLDLSVMETEKSEVIEVAADEAAETVEIVAEETVDEAVEVVAEHTVTAEQIIAEAKTIAGDVSKFDKNLYDTARVALAQLIAVEANEMAEGSNEINSISCLLTAVHALLTWYEGEEAEGEVEEMETEMAGEVELALAPDEEMCDGCGEMKADCKCDKAKTLTLDDIRETVTDIVKTMLTTSNDKTKAAAAERIEALETELAQVKSLATHGGPSRIGKVSAPLASNSNLLKAASLRAKAAATQDRTLAAGYTLLAEELEKDTTK